MAPSSLTAARVLSRHRHGAVVLRDEPATLDVIYSDGGIVTARDVARLIEQRIGLVSTLRFRPSVNTPPNGVAFEGLGESGEVVSGQVILHAGLRDDQVVCWAEVVRDEPGSKRTARFTTEARFAVIARLARDLVARIREEPTYPLHEVVAAVVRVVELAEIGSSAE